jgi:hypothetical protein
MFIDDLAMANSDELSLLSAGDVEYPLLAAAASTPLDEDKMMPTRQVIAVGI